MLGTAPNPEFWNGRSVLLTGHTGFKGAWALLWLHAMGARVTGFSLPPETDPAMIDQIGGESLCRSHLGDLRDLGAVERVVAESKPDIVLHMAAQPIVRRSIADPLETLAVNVQGTAHLLDAVRRLAKPQAVLVVTSDKVYSNDDQGRPFGEDDRLGGKDPYSASKAAAELVTYSFGRTYFDALGIPWAAARCGNIVGGGDYSVDRIIPDAVRAAAAGQPLLLRHPEATRPWLHVIDGVAGYFVFAERLVQDPATAPKALNFGPGEGPPLPVSDVASMMLEALEASVSWRHEPVPGSVEMKALAVDSALARKTLGWRDRIIGQDRMIWSAQWYKAARDGADLRAASLAQIEAYGALGA